MIVLYIAPEDKKSQALLRFLEQYPETENYIDVIDVHKVVKKGSLPGYVTAIPSLLVYKANGEVVLIPGVNSIADWVEEHFGSEGASEEEAPNFVQNPKGKSSPVATGGRKFALRNPKETKRAKFSVPFTWAEAERKDLSSMLTVNVTKSQSRDNDRARTEQQILSHMESVGHIKKKQEVPAEEAPKKERPKPASRATRGRQRTRREL